VFFGGLGKWDLVPIAIGIGKWEVRNSYQAPITNYHSPLSKQPSNHSPSNQATKQPSTNMARRRIFKQDEFRELGFGNRVVESNQRLMNKDGSSNVKRTGVPFLEATNTYHDLITMPWLKFIFIVFASYIFVNFIFAGVYFFVDPDHIGGMIYTNTTEKFKEIFFFSAQSLTTVGYGRLNPTSSFNSSLAAIESLTGLLGFALATGLLYGRFSRPVARILFSKNAVIAPYKGFTALMLRIANKNKSELLDPEATVVMSYVMEENGNSIRKFANLKLELTHVTLLTMSWTIVHPIDEESPMYNWLADDFLNRQVEFLVLIRAYEETFAQTVHARSSYRGEEVQFGAKFLPIIKPGENNSVTVELNKISDTTTAPLYEEIKFSEEPK
jgi:inward rectifier potassium channel